MRIKHLLLIIMVVLVSTTSCLGAEKSIELFMYTWWGGYRVDAIQKVANKWAEQHPGVTVHVALHPGAGNSMQRMITNTLANIQMDVVTLQAPYLQYVGMLQPLDPFINKGQYAIPQVYPPLVMEAFKYEGKIYGFPNLEAGVGMLFYWNKDLFALSGLPENVPPRTLDELLQFQRKLTKIDPNTESLTQLGINPTDGMVDGYIDIMLGSWFNVPWYDSAASRLNLTTFEHAVDYIKKLFETPGYSAAMKLPRWTAAIASQKQAMHINGSWVVGEIKNPPYQDRNINLGYSWVPTQTGEKVTAVAPWGLGIPRTSKYPELAYSLIEYFSSPAGAQMLFDDLGWLNSNIKTMPRLNLRAIPDMKNAINMFLSADRVGAPLPLPNLEEIRAALGKAALPVWKGEVSARVALEGIDGPMNQKLQEALKR